MQLPRLFLLPLLGLLTLGLCSTSSSSSSSLDDEFTLPPSSASAAQNTVTLHAWPLTSASPTPLGKATWSSTTLAGSWELLGDAALGDGDAEELVRVGVPAEDGTWSGSVTTRGMIRDGAVTLRWDAADKRVWFVEVAMAVEAAPKVMVVKAAPGVMPELNKPIVLTADGKIPVPQVEKTLLQK
ncbi:hypothetical protein BZA05DRAFT_457376 [Tricharina praecox]|uniref:uncharacterized protein n=1 Tax=Tricharina praecox TaxID=43433 RepID=UPI00221F8B7F|nr:uncharacterized protein BZA05DRAFT_457376 [Tricharina praecox]KAI5848174.1 hypothetical protein BZA05DRAFT_457376 [Tricharina praecox]